MNTAVAHKALLTDNGLKATPARLAVLALLSKEAKPISATDILAALGKKSADQATVYRIIEAFADAGIVRRVELKKGQAYYELAARPHHHHVVCTKCSRVEDVYLPEAAVDRQVERQTRFAVREHAMEFFGLCPKCK